MRIGGTGHRLLPIATVQLVEPALREEIATLDTSNLIGVSCLADGADRIFADAILEVDAALEIIVPSDGYREALPLEHWPAYDRISSQARSITRLPFPASTSDAHMAASRLVVDTSELLLAVWDGEPARAFGGTADIVAYAHEKGVPVRIIWPNGATRD